MTKSTLINIVTSIFGENLNKEHGSNHTDSFFSCVEHYSPKGFVNCEFSVELKQGILSFQVADGELKGLWKPNRCGEMNNPSSMDISSTIDALTGIDTLLNSTHSNAVIEAITEYESICNTKHQATLDALTEKLQKTHSKMDSEATVKKLLDFMKRTTPNDDLIAIKTTALNTDGTLSEETLRCEKSKAGRSVFSLDYDKLTINPLTTRLWDMWITKELYNEIHG